MKSTALIFSLFFIVHAYGQGGDLDSLLNNLSKPGPGSQQESKRPNPSSETGLEEETKVCSLEDDSEGECVPYFLCDNNVINTEGVGIIDIRIAGPCEDYMQTCCKLSGKIDTPITPKPPAVKASGCGIRNPEGVGFRIKGDKDNEAQFGEFGWMVAILREEVLGNKSQKLNVYQCGGSLIHPKVVMTAAHCVVGAPKLKVRAGEWDTQTKNEILPHQDRDVATIIKHKDYYPGGLFNDIALLILKSPMDEADNIGVVCLPPHSAAAPPNRCLASGWGKDVFGKEGKYQVILKKVQLPIVERPKCQRLLRKTRLGKNFELHKSFICAGGESGKDTCKGDGGSPLVCPMANHPDRYMQSGIVAWGIGCNDEIPGVYVNVAYLREWIDEKLRDNYIDMSPYTLL